jgi:hypothetical protein
MIISHRHKFIFLKTNKTAGTSIEIALSEFCGDQDIITPISPPDEKIRAELGYAGPQNFLAPIADYRFTDIGRLILTGRRKRLFYNHISAKDIRQIIGEEVWSGYFKFCVERNPWERVVSLYYHIHLSEPRPSFSSFIDSDAPLILKRRGLDLYTIDGELAVDRICRFERLDDELRDVAEHLKLPSELKLPRAKSQFRPDKRSPADLMSSRDRDRIGHIFEDEIRRFGYAF